MLTKNIIILTFCIAASTVAETLPTSVPENKGGDTDVARIGHLDAERLAQLALSEEVKDNERVWLNVNYPEQREPVKVLALAQKPRLPQPQGAVLILHDQEQHANWPYFIRPLRDSLPDAGWHTLSVNLPYEDAKKVPARSVEIKKHDQILLNEHITSALQRPAARPELVGEALETNSDEPVPDALSDSGTANENEETVEEATPTESVDIDLQDKNKTKKMISYRERAVLHVNAAIDYLRNEGYQNIIIVGYRGGANVALDYIKPNIDQIPSRGFALVMVNPMLNAAYQTDLAGFFGDAFQAPILDITNGSDLASRDLARERVIGARVAEIEHYYQVSLDVNQSNLFQQALTRRIRYWLAKYAPGMAATKITQGP